MRSGYIKKKILHSYSGIWIPLLVFVVAILAYLPSLDNELVYDDSYLIGKDTRITKSGHIDKIWSHDYWPGNRPSYNFRPLTTTTFYFVARMSENSITAQRWFNIVLHALCSVLTFFITIRLGLPSSGALLVGILFALHPLHSEAIYLIVGRSELLVAFLGLCFLLGVIKDWPLWVLSLFFGLAIFAKENAVILPVLGLFLFYRQNNSAPYKVHVIYGLKLVAVVMPFLVILFILRYKIFGIFLSPPNYVDPLYNPISMLPGLIKILNALWTQILYLKAVLWPFNLKADYSNAEITLLDSWYDLKLLAVVALSMFMFYLLTSKRRLLCLESSGLLFYFIAIIPVSNIIFTIGVLFGERLAYFPSVGVCIAIGALVVRLLHLAGSFRWMKVMIIVPVVLLLCVCVYTILNRDQDWRNQETFTAAMIDDSPNSALSHGLRFLYLKNLDRNKAEYHLRKAIEIYPSYYDAWDSLGDFLAEEHKHDLAADAYISAAHLVAQTPFDANEAGVFFLKAAHMQLKSEDCESAWQSIQHAKKWLTPSDIQIRKFENELWQKYCR